MEPSKIILSILLAFQARLFADAPGVGTTSANFLKLGSSARPAAMGEAYVSLADDAGGLAYNPAGLLLMNHSSLQATHTAWFKGVYYEELGLALALHPGTSMGFSFSYVGLPSQQRTVATGAGSSDPLDNFRDVGSFSPFDMHGAWAYSRLWGESFRTGGTINVTSQNIAGSNAVGLGLDLGCIADTGIDNLNWGLAIQNLGFAIPLVKESFGLPMLFRAGASYRYMETMLLSVELDMPNDNGFVAALGGEINIQKYVFLRLGYRMDSIFNPFSAGLGFKMADTMLDLVWVPAGELGQTYRFSLAYNWGGWVSSDTAVDLRVLSGIMARGGQAPASSPFKLQPMVSDPRLVKGWSVEIKGAEGAGASVHKVISGTGPFGEEVAWDGTGETGGPAPDGGYDAVLKVQLKSGADIASAPRRLLLNPPLPDSSFDIDPNSLGGDSDMFVPTDMHVHSVPTALPLRWRLEFWGPDQKLFHFIEGALGEAANFQWNGLNAKGEAFYSNTVYTLKYSLIDAQGNTVKSQAPISKRVVFRR